MTSSATGPVYRDPPPHSIANPPGRGVDTRGRLPDNSNPPRRPRRGSVSPRAENREGIPRQYDTGRSSNLYPHVPPGIETHMDVDPERLERSSYFPSPSISRGSRSQVEERIEAPEGPRSSRPPPPKSTLPMNFHPGFPQGSNSSDYTNFGPQLRPIPSAYGTSKYDQKKTDGYPDRDQGPSERRPAMAYGDRGPPVSARIIIYSPDLYPFPQPRRDVRTRPEGSTRQPPPHISGTNNIPIGIRRGAGTPSNLPLSLPSDGLLNSPFTPFNPDARPPSSTLINPGKGRELPTGKESYERVRFYQAAAFIASNFVVVSPKEWLFLMIDLGGCHYQNLNVAAHL